MVFPAVVRERSWRKLLRAETCSNRSPVRGAHGSNPASTPYLAVLVSTGGRTNLAMMRGSDNEAIHTIHHSMTSGEKAQSTRGVIRRRRVLAGACSSHSKGWLGRPETGRHRWPGLTGPGVAIVPLATKSWMMVGHSYTGKNRAAMHERDGNGRRVPKASNVRNPGPARQVDAGERRKAFAGET